MPTPATSVVFEAKDYADRAFSYYARYHPRDNAIAMGLYQQAIEADPNYSAAYSGLANVYAQGYLQFGKDYSWTERAVNLAKKSIQLSPDNTQGYKALGLSLLSQGKFKAALAANEVSAKLLPTWAAPVNNNAEIYQKMGDLVLAYQTNIRAIQLDVKDPIPYLHFGNSFHDMVMPEHAQRAYQDALSLRPDYLLARNYLAEFYNSQKKYMKSLEIVSETLVIDPANSRALYSGAISHLMSGQRQVAMEFFERASVSVRPSYLLHARVRLAILQDNPMLLEEVKTDVEQTIRRGNEWSSYSYLLALIHASQGKEQQALTILKQAASQGFTDYRWAQTDPMLASLHKNADFILLMRQTSDRVGRMRDRVIRLENITP